MVSLQIFCRFRGQFVFNFSLLGRNELSPLTSRTNGILDHDFGLLFITSEILSDRLTLSPSLQVCLLMQLLPLLLQVLFLQTAVQLRVVLLIPAEVE